MKKFVAWMLTMTMMLCCFGGALADGYTVGEYTAAAKGMGGDVNVKVTFTADAIASVEVGEHAETPGISDPAIAKIPAEIVQYQSLAVDTIAGATLTSNAILAAVEECVALAGGDVEALKNVEIVKNGKDINMEADVVVIGVGAAGAAAALKAAEEGLTVVALEKQASAGGQAIVSGGILYGTGSKAQADRGLTNDTPKALADYWLMMNPDANQELLMKIAEMSGETIDWIVEMGVEFHPELKAQGIDTVDRGLTAANEAGGYGLMQPMIDKINENEKIKMLLSTRGTQLKVDEQGNISNVIAYDADGNCINIATSAAIICTNNIDGNEELMKEFHPAFSVYTRENWPYTGDGHIMAREIGANLVAYPNRFVGSVMPIGGLQVNDKGNRFTNEAGFYGDIWNDMVATCDSMETIQGVMILDNKTLETADCVWHMPDGKGYTWADLVEKGWDENFKFATAANGKSYKANTLEELAVMIGVPYENLQATVDRYNELYELGEDVDFGKDAQYLYKIEEGPFYGYSAGLIVTMFSCGIDVDNNMQVKREDGSVIGGLYAAGFAACENFKPNQYPGSGSAIAYSMNSGVIAAESAAAYLNK